MSTRDPATLVPLTERPLGPLVLRRYPPSHPFAMFEPIVAAVGVAGLLGMFLLPLDLFARFVGPCEFHLVTGYPCLSCGATRAVLALGHWQFAQAVRMNPLVAIVVIAGALYTPVALWLWLGRRPRVRVGFNGRAARWSALAMFVLALAAQWVFLAVDGR